MRDEGQRPGLGLHSPLLRPTPHRSLEQRASQLLVGTLGEATLTWWLQLGWMVAPVNMSHQRGGRVRGTTPQLRLPGALQLQGDLPRPTPSHLILIAVLVSTLQRGRQSLFKVGELVQSLRIWVGIGVESEPGPSVCLSARIRSIFVTP